VHLLYAAKFKPRQCYRYGRAGQAQYGVDVVARDAQTQLWTGIQCKLKTELLSSKLTQQHLIDTCEISCRFSSGLEKLWVATTCPTDATVQDLASAISSSFQRRNPVEVLFWEEIEEMLDRYDQVANRFYPEFFPDEKSLNEADDGDLLVTLTENGWDVRLERLFRHRGFVAATSNQRVSLMTIVSELIDNAFSRAKGGASRVHVALLGSVLSVSDDGQRVSVEDDSTALTSRMKGIRAIRSRLQQAGTALMHEYVPADQTVTRYHVNRFHIISPGVLP
jgi:Restriction endonuclease